MCVSRTTTLATLLCSNYHAAKAVSALTHSVNFPGGRPLVDGLKGEGEVAALMARRRAASEKPDGNGAEL